MERAKVVGTSCSGIHGGRIESIRSYGDGEAGVEAHDGTDFPTSDHLIRNAIHATTELASAAERQLVVARDGDVVRSIEVRRTIIRATVICILPIRTLRVASTAACTVVAQVIAQALAVSPVGQELEAVVEATSSGYLQRAVVHNSFRLGKADVCNLAQSRIENRQRGDRKRAAEVGALVSFLGIYQGISFLSWVSDCHGVK